MSKNATPADSKDTPAKTENRYLAEGRNWGRCPKCSAAFKSPGHEARHKC